MMRSKSESARARRLLNAILPHAIALEALELEQEILAMIETIDSNLVHDSAWKNFLDKVQRSARSAMRKIKKEESAGENEMESDAGEADGDTEKQIKIKAENQPVNLNLMSTVLNTDGAELEIPG